MLILASQSASRRAMLDAAGVPFEAMAAGVDEEAMKTGLRAEGVSPRNLADALAELKATKLSTTVVIPAQAGIHRRTGSEPGEARPGGLVDSRLRGNDGEKAGAPWPIRSC